MSISPGYVAFKLAFQISPIILTRGIATNFGVGGLLPIVALTEGANFAIGLLTGGPNIELDDFFAHYTPMPGTTLQANDVAMYPFANQAIAANAIIAKPLNVSLMMNISVRKPLGYAIKLATMTALQKTLAQHNGMGGTYSIVTPSYIFVDCIMTAMRDISSGESKQSQYMWQLDFIQPLVSLQAANGALNTAMQKITAGLPPSSGAQSFPAAGLGTANLAPLTAVYPPATSAGGFGTPQ